MMKNVIITIFILVSQLTFAQTDIARQIDSLRFVTEMPYICNGFYIEGKDTVTIGCGDDILWDVVALRKEAIRPLIDCLCDTTQTEAPVLFYGGVYTVADVACVALREIIHGFPTFELLGVRFNKVCGYCSYWMHVQENINNRRKFQQAVQRWFDKNESRLIWVKNNEFEICECFGAHPAGGHFEEINRYLSGNIETDADSITIKYFEYYNRETSTPGEKTSYDNFPKLGSSAHTLTARESKTMYKYLLSENSYINEHPLLSDVDINISFYRHGAIYQHILISSVTRKICIFGHNSTVEQRISPAFEQYLTRLLRKKGIWDKNTGFAPTE